MKRILSLFVALLFVAGCGGGEVDLGDFTPTDPPELGEFTPDFDLSDFDREISDADHVPDEIVSLFVASFGSDSAKARIIKELRENIPCFRALEHDTDEEIWDRLVYAFDLDNIEDWGSNLEEAVRNILVIRMGIEPDDTLGEIWGEMVDRIGGC